MLNSCIKCVVFSPFYGVVHFDLCDSVVFDWIVGIVRALSAAEFGAHFETAVLEQKFDYKLRWLLFCITHLYMPISENKIINCSYLFSKYL